LNIKASFPVIQLQKQTMEQQLDLQGVNAGIYFLRVTTTENRTAVLKLVVVDH
jgi:hypothetical protein